MAKTRLRKSRWTLSFDPALKSLVVKAARRRGTYPVAVLEEIVRERFNPYGHADIKDSVAYVKSLRQQARKQTDEDFLAEIEEWQRSRSS